MSGRSELERKAFFEAQSQVKDALNHRREKWSAEVEKLKAELAEPIKADELVLERKIKIAGLLIAESKLEAYEEMHSYVRNVVLFFNGTEDERKNGG